MSYNPHFSGLLPGAMPSAATGLTDLDRLLKLKSDILAGMHPIYYAPDTVEATPPGTTADGPYPPFAPESKRMTPLVSPTPGSLTSAHAVNLSEGPASLDTRRSSTRRNASAGGGTTPETSKAPANRRVPKSHRKEVQKKAASAAPAAAAAAASSASTDAATLAAENGLTQADGQAVVDAANAMSRSSKSPRTAEVRNPSGNLAFSRLETDRKGARDHSFGTDSSRRSHESHYSIEADSNNARGGESSSAGEGMGEVEGEDADDLPSPSTSMSPRGSRHGTLGRQRRRPLTGEAAADSENEHSIGDDRTLSDDREGSVRSMSNAIQATKGSKRSRKTVIGDAPSIAEESADGNKQRGHRRPITSEHVQRQLENVAANARRKGNKRQTMTNSQQPADESTSPHRQWQPAGPFGAQRRDPVFPVHQEQPYAEHSQLPFDHRYRPPSPIDMRGFGNPYQHTGGPPPMQAVDQYGYGWDPRISGYMQPPPGYYTGPPQFAPPYDPRMNHAPTYDPHFDPQRGVDPYPATPSHFPPMGPMSQPQYHGGPFVGGHPGFGQPNHVGRGRGRGGRGRQQQQRY